MNAKAITKEANIRPEFCPRSKPRPPRIAEGATQSGIGIAKPSAYFHSMQALPKAINKRAESKSDRGIKLIFLT